MIGANTIFFTGCEGVRAHRMCKPGDILTLSIKPKRMKMPLATFEGAIRVGQEKAVIAEDITLTFAFVEATVAPAAMEGAAQPAAGSDSSANPPLRVAMNA
jgi:3-hydroxyacyl-[acyl-carrier-protein] dehydratase